MTYYRKDNSFYKSDGDLIKCISISTDEVSIKVVSALPEYAAEIKEEDYTDAVCSVTKFGCVGGHPDIPPSA